MAEPETVLRYWLLNADAANVTAARGARPRAEVVA